MKRAVLCIIFSLSYFYSTAQFYDKAWLVDHYGDIKMTYVSNVPDTITYLWYNSNYIYFNDNGSNISDTSGNILFFSNGGRIGTSQRLLMENGDNLLDSILNIYYGNSGYSQPTSNLILPKERNQFYFFYVSESDSFFQLGVPKTDYLYYAIIDMDSNGGLGKVISKKNLIWNGKQSGKLIDDTRLTACRHANGRDWWLISHAYLTNEYIIYLATPDSVYPPVIQHIGPNNARSNVGQSVFSPDGSLFASVLPSSPVTILGFDRCTGTFSFRDTLPLHYDTIRSQGHIQVSCDPYSAMGCSFSANGRYLFVSTFCYLMQFDMLADTISKSGILVAQLDTSEYPSPLFYNSFLMPNGEILMCSWQWGPHNFHLIKSPDLQAPGCDFRYYGFATNSRTATGLPNMVNYRMGAMHGSACDTITGLEQVNGSDLKALLYPNPANEMTQLDIRDRDLREQLSFVMYDVVGKEIWRKVIPYYQLLIPRGTLTSGIYTWQIQNAKGQVKTTGKLVWE